MVLELIAEFDSFLARRLTQYGNPGSGHLLITSYM